MRLDDHPLLDTAAVGAARETAARHLSPALLAHSMRAWYWAAGFERVLGVEADDPELLAVAALLHDVGLAPEFDAVQVPFETAGGHVAWVLAAGAGWSVRRRDRLIEVIERHMWRQVDPAEDPEGHLLEIATALDISGARAGVLPEEFVREVLAAHPRGALAVEFGARLEKQAERKPASQAARLVDGGLAGRLARNPLEALGAGQPPAANSSRAADSEPAP